MMPTLLGTPTLLGFLGQDQPSAVDRLRPYWPQIAGALALASASVSAYHGFKRNGTVLGGIWWFFLGSIFPVITPIAAFALPPGYAKPKR